MGSFSRSVRCAISDPDTIWSLTAGSQGKHTARRGKLVIKLVIWCEISTSKQLTFQSFLIACDFLACILVLGLFRFLLFEPLLVLEKWQAAETCSRTTCISRKPRSSPSVHESEGNHNSCLETAPVLCRSSKYMFVVFKHQFKVCSDHWSWQGERRPLQPWTAKPPKTLKMLLDWSSRLFFEPVLHSPAGSDLGHLLSWSRQAGHVVVHSRVFEWYTQQAIDVLGPVWKELEATGLFCWRFSSSDFVPLPGLPKNVMTMQS